MSFQKAQRVFCSSYFHQSHSGSEAIMSLLPPPPPPPPHFCLLIQVSFEDVLAEPDGAHSADCVWKCSYNCFTCAKGCCYNFLAILCGVPLALCWGCEFAMITFSHVWQITPCLRVFMINCGCAQKFFGTCLQCLLAPVCETCGLLFSNIVIKKS